MNPSRSYTARFFLWGIVAQWLVAALVWIRLRPAWLSPGAQWPAATGWGLAGGAILILLLIQDPWSAIRSATRMKVSAVAVRAGFILGNSVAEELVWRGLVLASASHVPFGIAAILATVPYAGLHAATQGRRGFQVHLAMGLLFCAMAHAMGGLLGVAVAHIFYNLALVARGYGKTVEAPDAQPAAVLDWAGLPGFRARPARGAVAAAAAPVIEFLGVSKAYLGVAALDDVSFAVPSGEITAILGPNGAGKTTLLEILEGLKQPDRGEVRLHGESVRRARQAPGRRPGVILQDNRLPPKLTVAETLRLFRAFAANPLPVGGLEERFRLGALRRRTTETLSGGERQRLALAIAVMEQPSILILDEPTASLDPHARRDFWSEIRLLNHDGCTIVLATHLIDEAEALCSRVVILHRGRLAAAGTPADLRAMARAGYRVAFCGGGAGGMLKREERAAPDVATGLEIAREMAARAGGSTLSVTVARPSLQDAFFDLTGELFEP